MRNGALDQHAYAAALGACVGNVAVIDCSGKIIAVNHDWLNFAKEHGAHRSKVSIGANYLRVCQEAKAIGQPEAARALEGIIDVLEGVVPEFRLEYRCDTGPPESWFEMIVHPLCRPEGGAIITHLSIDSRHAAECRALALAQDLAQIHRLTVLSNLTNSFAHELAQPLTAIKVNAHVLEQILTKQKMESSTVNGALADIIADNLRAAKLIQQLRSMLKKGAGGFRPLCINSVIRSVASVLRGVARVKRVKVSLHLEPKLPLICGDRLQLQQVMLNLLTNAFEAMHRTRVERREVVVTTSLGADNRVLISVQDAGSGISVGELGSIFKPFFTTKRKGLGMGLAICRSLVEAHHGDISVDNNPGKGVTFRLTIPSTTASAL